MTSTQEILATKKAETKEVNRYGKVRLFIRSPNVFDIQDFS